MPRITIDSGICGFSTTITTTSEDRQHVRIAYETECPHAARAREALTEVDAFQEVFRKPHETKVYQTLSPHLPHAACPLSAGFLKAIEVAAGLALPKDVSIKIEA
ncbi:MAG: hypothetical protein JW820_10475 [Spirochaetales bacterium]|nr:hypothetical protein [Spirochaetales bacterium]